jgi:hypothetical protein
MNLAVAVLMLLAGQVCNAASCPPEELVHAKKIYAPLPYLRPLLPSCEQIGPPTVKLVIGENGQVLRYRFVRSTGCNAADEKLGSCLKHWRYKPAKCSARAVTECLTLTINWHLEEASGDQDPCGPDTGSSTGGGTDAEH